MKPSLPAVLLPALFLATALFGTDLHAQPIGKYFSRVDLGISGFLYSHEQDYTANGIDEHADQTLFHFGILFGFNVPFLQLADHLTVGVNPSFGFGLGSSGSSYYTQEPTPSLSLEIPWFLTMKWGTDATLLGSKTAIGASIGIGAQYSYLIWLEGETETYNYVLPTYMVELNFGKRKSEPGLIKLRYTANIGSYLQQEEFGDDALYENRLRQSAVHLIYTPGY